MPVHDTKAMLDLLSGQAKSLKLTATNEATRPVYNYAACRRFTAYRLYLSMFELKGLPVDDDTHTAGFADGVVTKFLSRLTELDQCDAAHGVSLDFTDGLPKLKSFASWFDFKELLSTALLKARNTASVPLAYLVRDHTDVTDEIRSAPYPSIDEELISTTVLTGSHFAVDNKRLWDGLKALCLGGSVYHFISKFDRKRDGRAAWLALVQQAEGEAAKEQRKNDAYTSIKTARFSGRNKFSFASYTARHQEGHNILSEEGEPVPEHKKVSDFLAGISDPRMANLKDIVNSDVDKRNNFTACQIYLETSLKKRKTDDKAASEATAKIGALGGKPPPVRKPFKPKHSTKRAGIKRHYSKAEWAEIRKDPAKYAAVLAARNKKDPVDPKSVSSVTAQDIHAIVAAAVAAALPSSTVSGVVSDSDPPMTEPGNAEPSSEGTAGSTESLAKGTALSFEAAKLKSAGAQFHKRHQAKTKASIAAAASAASISSVKALTTVPVAPFEKDISLAKKRRVIVLDDDMEEDGYWTDSGDDTDSDDDDASMGDTDDEDDPMDAPSTSPLPVKNIAERLAEAADAAEAVADRFKLMDAVKDKPVSSPGLYFWRIANRFMELQSEKNMHSTFQSEGDRLEYYDLKDQIDSIVREAGESCSDKACAAYAALEAARGGESIAVCNTAYIRGKRIAKDARKGELSESE